MIATEKTINERLAVCEKCSDKILKNGFELCGKCGCELRGKASIGHSTCPLKKWNT